MIAQVSGRCRQVLIQKKRGPALPEGMLGVGAGGV